MAGWRRSCVGFVPFGVLDEGLVAGRGGCGLSSRWSDALDVSLMD